MQVCVVRKWPLRGRSRFVCWNITRVSLWLLCTVQRASRAKYANDPPTNKTIRAWYEQVAAVKNIDAPTLTRMWQELE
jgi:hypothetical protein